MYLIFIIIIFLVKVGGMRVTQHKTPKEGTESSTAKDKDAQEDDTTNALKVSTRYGTLLAMPLF
jgi:uncharacterized protein YceK